MFVAFPAVSDLPALHSNRQWTLPIPVNNDFISPVLNEILSKLLVPGTVFIGMLLTKKLLHCFKKCISMFAFIE